MRAPIHPTPSTRGLGNAVHRAEQMRHVRLTMDARGSSKCVRKLAWPDGGDGMRQPFEVDGGPAH